MKKLFFAIAALVSFVNVSSQTTWKVDKAHSSITFSVSHYMISEVTGSFKKFDITATSNEKFENPSFDVAINTASIDTNQSGRDKHLQAPDFFDAANHANIVFKSTAFKQLEGKDFETTGTITIKGISKEIMFKGTLNGIIKGRSGKQKAGIKLTAPINREAFNLGKGMGSIGKDVQVIVNIEMNEQ